jgi:hypothetical protein
MSGTLTIAGAVSTSAREDRRLCVINRAPAVLAVNRVARVTKVADADESVASPIQQ